jgi:hypothetical protein
MDDVAYVHNDVCMQFFLLEQKNYRYRGIILRVHNRVVKVLPQDIWFQTAFARYVVVRTQMYTVSACRAKRALGLIYVVLDDLQVRLKLLVVQYLL